MSEATHALELAAPLTTFEAAFIRAVLEHRGVFAEPSDAQLTAAIDALKRYDQQCADNPGGSAWEPTRLDEASQAELRAKAFILFGATRPTPAQWLQAHNALYDTQLFESFG